VQTCDLSGAKMLGSNVSLPNIHLDELETINRRSGSLAMPGVADTQLKDAVGLYRHSRKTLD
jgi:hypothetical protein